MKQVGVDICNLPETDGYCHIIVLIDYFWKWSEANPTKDQSTPTVAQFFYKVMCRHGCFDVQINDQGREFVNQECDELHKLTGVEQRVTSAYHPQANGLVECQNRTIKNYLVKVLEDNHEMWPHIIEGILFANRVSCHSSTKYSPFMMLYNREPALPIDVKHNLDREKEGESEDENQEPLDLEYFDAVFKSGTKVKTSIKDDAVENIKAAQKKQKRDYDRRHMSNPEISGDDMVLIKNNK